MTWQAGVESTFCLLNKAFINSVLTCNKPGFKCTTSESFYSSNKRSQGNNGVVFHSNAEFKEATADDQRKRAHGNINTQCSITVAVIKNNLTPGQRFLVSYD